MNWADLYDHQRDAVGRLKSGKILLGSTGSGKSIASLYYFYDTYLGVKELGKTASPRDLYVITTAKKRDELDWIKEAALFGIGTERDTSLGGVQLSVDSWNNISKYEEVKDAFFIFDEQRLVSTGSWSLSFLKIARQNDWIMLTATPGDTWLDYANIFIANGLYKNITEFRKRHVVYSYFGGYPKVERYLDTDILDRHRDSVVVIMEDQRHTHEHRIDIPLIYDRDAYRMVAKKHWNPFTDEPIENASQRFHLMRKVVNTSPARLNKLLEICTTERRVIVFYNYRYELELIKEALHNANIPFAEWNGQKHEEVPDTDRWVYLVQYTAGAEGWNCTTTNHIVFYSLNYSWRIMEQAEGRINRINTPYVDLYYHRFTSLSGVDRGIEHILKKKKRFNMQTFMNRWSDV